jgi:hypothetical protein
VRPMMNSTAFLVAASLSCAASKISFYSSTYPANWIAIDRLLIVTNFQNGSFDQKMYRALGDGLRIELGACNVASKILQFDPLGVEGMIDKVARAFQATATLAIVARGNEVVKTHAIGFAEKAYFELAIFHAESGNVVWRADSVLDLGVVNPLDNEDRIGCRFASSIITRLEADGILKACTGSIRVRLQDDAVNKALQVARSNPPSRRWVYGLTTLASPCEPLAPGP